MTGSSFTNTVTATGVLDDPAATSATQTASATVTGDTCTISIVKTASSPDVCVGGSVGYTITVTNNSTNFTWTGRVVDDVLGILAASVTLAPGKSVTYTPTDVIDQARVTNIATATGAFGDPSNGTSARDHQRPVTVTSHACDITVTKVPAASAVCDGATVTYTYTVTNNSDEFTLDRQPHRRHPGPGRHGPRDPRPRRHRDVHRERRHHGHGHQHRHRHRHPRRPRRHRGRRERQRHGHGEDCTITVTKIASATRRVRRRTVDLHITVTNDSDSFAWTGTVGRRRPGHRRRERHHRSPASTVDLHPAGRHHGHGHQHRHRDGLFDDPQPPRPPPPATP